MANSEFPKLANAKHDYAAQRKILWHAGQYISFLCASGRNLCGFSTPDTGETMLVEKERPF